MILSVLILGVLAVVAEGPPAVSASAGVTCAGGGEEERAHTVSSARYLVAYRTRPRKIEVGQHFAVELAVCPRGETPPPEGVRVDAHMPEHRHGMNYRTTVVEEGAGRYRADGLLLHMPGRWEFIFEVRAAGRTDRLTRSFELE